MAISKYLAMALSFHGHLSFCTLTSSHSSGPMADQAIAVAWGVRSLEFSNGFTPIQNTALASFSTQSDLLEPSNYTTIWDYFPSVDRSRYPLMTGPIMQDPQDQDPHALVATACDSCARSDRRRLVNLPANSSDWTVIWKQAYLAYEKLLAGNNTSNDTNSTGFKMAMNWYTSIGNSSITSDTMDGGNTSISSSAEGTSPSLGVKDAVCSTIYLEGLTGISNSNAQEILTVLPTHFQDLSTDCGCDFEDLGPGSGGSPFQGGWKVVMKDATETWRFRIESPGTGCISQGPESG